jgi:hypothetical protein
MVEVDLYISAYSCLMGDQTRMSQYVEVVLAWLRKQSDPWILICPVISFHQQLPSRQMLVHVDDSMTSASTGG